MLSGKDVKLSVVTSKGITFLYEGEFSKGVMQGMIGCMLLYKNNKAT